MFLELLKSVRNSNGAFPCPICQQEHSHPSSVRRHVKLSCPAIKYNNEDTDPTSCLATQVNPDFNDSSSEISDGDLDDSELDMPSDVSSEQEMAVHVESEDETHQIELHWSLFQNEMIKTRFPHIAIHTPTGYVVCLSCAFMSDIARFFTHCQHKKHSAFTNDDFEELRSLFTSYEIANEDLIEEFFASCEDEGYLPFLGLPLDGFECAYCPKIFASKQALRNHHRSSHPLLQFVSLLCKYQKYWVVCRTHAVHFKVNEIAFPTNDVEIENDHLIRERILVRKGVIENWNSVTRYFKDISLHVSS